MTDKQAIKRIRESHRAWTDEDKRKFMEIAEIAFRLYFSDDIYSYADDDLMSILKDPAHDMHGIAVDLLESGIVPEDIEVILAIIKKNSAILAERPTDPAAESA